MNGEARPQVGPRVRLGAAWWVCAAAVCGGLAWLALGGRVLHGGLLMAAGFALAAVLRLTLSDERVGGLHIRSRRTDVMVNVVVAVAVATAAVLVHLREGV